MDHGTKALPLRSETFDILNKETGERVRVIVEQLGEPKSIWASGMDTMDVLVEDILEGQGSFEGFDVLKVKHPYIGGAQ